MDYQKSIQNLLKEAKESTSYQQLGAPYRIFLKIALFPLIVLEFVLIMLYYVQLFFYNALMAPVSYLETWLEKKKDGVFHATQAVLFFIATPFIFSLRILLSLMSFDFFFQWFFLMCNTYLVTLGGVKWQPCINVVPEKTAGETKLKSDAGEKFATVALLFMVLAVVLIPFVKYTYDALSSALFAYGVVIILVNAIVSTKARYAVDTETLAPQENVCCVKKNGIFDNIVFSCMMLAFVGLWMFIQAWVSNGVAIFVDAGSLYYGGYYPNVLPFIALILIGIAIVMGIIKLILMLCKGIVVNAKTILAGILLVVCLGTMSFGTVQYIRYAVGDNTQRQESDYYTTTTIMAAAKKSSMVKNAIAEKWEIESFATYTYNSSCKTTKTSSGWTVTLYGTVSGYDSSYAYKIGKGFIANVSVSKSGEVLSVSVNKSY